MLCYITKISKIESNSQRITLHLFKLRELCYITKISKIESNSQQDSLYFWHLGSCVISQRYPKLKAIHNERACKLQERSCVISQRYPKLKAIHNKLLLNLLKIEVVLYHKDIKIESNSQLECDKSALTRSCVISQRYPKLKAIHNTDIEKVHRLVVVLYHKDIQN